MNLKHCFFVGVAATATSAASPAHAAIGVIATAKVVRTLVSADSTVNYGGCGAALSVNSSTATPATTCPVTPWVSFSCNGTYASKDIAFQMFDQAQMALAMNKSVRVELNDAKKHNGVCFVNRIDIIP